MSDKPFEFAAVGLVDGDELLAEPYRAVIGRCGDVSISVGDIFDAIVRYEKPRTIEDYERDPIEVGREPVRLTVRHIRAYEREREALERGMTGALVLTGEGLESLDRQHGTFCLTGVGTMTTVNGHGHLVPATEPDARDAAGR